MGRQNPFYRVNEEKETKSAFKTEKIPAPPQLSERHKNLHLYMDIFNVNDSIFLHTKIEI